MCDMCRVRRPASATSAPEPARAHAGHAVLALQRAAGNRATGRLLARDGAGVRRPSWFMPESPTINIWALQNQQFGASSVRPLTTRERDVASAVYGESLDLDRVRIARTSILAAPTTLANTIRVKGEISDGILVHELMHVWQYQTSGLRYISCALAGQIEGAVGHGDRNWTYEYDRTRTGTTLNDYGPEQQAQIVEDAFLTNQLTGDSFYGPKVAQVRRARPRPDDPGRDIDEAAGVGPRRTAPPPMTFGSTDPRAEEMGGNVPQLQWSF